MSVTMTGEAPASPTVKIWWKELWVQVMIGMAVDVALGAVRPQINNRTRHRR